MNITVTPSKQARIHITVFASHAHSLPYVRRSLHLTRLSDSKVTGNILQMKHRAQCRSALYPRLDLASVQCLQSGRARRRLELLPINLLEVKISTVRVCRSTVPNSPETLSSHLWEFPLVGKLLYLV